MKSAILLKQLCFITLLICARNADAGVVISRNTGEPIIYASVGVVDRSLGTVTDSLGRFSLAVPAEYANDSLRISSVGYKPMTYALQDRASIPDTIRLDEDVINLAEIIVKPLDIRHKVAGRKSSGGFIYINVEGYKAAGQGLAVPLKVKKRAWLREIGFTVVVDNHTLSHMKFRVNVYAREDGKYVPLTSVRQYYFDYSKSDLNNGLFRYRFPEEIMLDKGEYYVELEFLENFTNELFMMKTRPVTGKTRYRYASQSDWETLPFGAPLYVEYDSAE